MANNTVPTKSTGDTLTAAEINDIATKANTKQEPLGFTPENVTNKGAANGYAALDGTGKVPVSQLPAGGGGGGTGDITPDSVMVNNPQGQPGGAIRFVGDSITAGQGASVVGNRYSTLVALALGATEHNFGVSGQKASGVNLTNIPTKASTDKYLFIGYGTNEVINGPTTTGEFNTAMTAILNDAVAKGWTGADIVLLSTYYSTFTTGNDAALRANNAVIAALAIAYGAYYVECYDSIRNLVAGGVTAISADNIHPNDIGYVLIKDGILGVLPAVFAITNEKEVVNGNISVKDLNLRGKRSISGKSAHKYLLGIDAAGNVGAVNSIKDGIELNQVFLSGNVQQTGAALPTGFDVLKDFAMNLYARLYWAFSAGVYAFIGVDNLLNITLSTNYSASTIKLQTAAGDALTANPDGSIDIPFFINFENNKYIKGHGGLTSNKMTPITAAGHMEFEVGYTTGVYNFYTSMGTTNDRVLAFSIDQNGRVILATTKDGFLNAKLTTTQRDAISSPPEGLEIYNTTLHKKQFYNGSAWETITSA